MEGKVKMLLKFGGEVMGWVSKLPPVIKAPKREKILF